RRPRERAANPPVPRHPEVLARPLPAISEFTRVFDALWRASKGDGPGDATRTRAAFPAVILRGPRTKRTGCKKRRGMRAHLRMTERGAAFNGIVICLRRRNPAQPLDDVRRGLGIDAREEIVQLLATTRRVDAEPALVGVGHELRILEGLEERRLHGGDAIR